jgi:hypothetical protein
MGLRRWVREALGEAPFSGTIFVFPVQSPNEPTA